MPSAISGGGRIRTNIPAEQAYNANLISSQARAQSQLRLSTGKRINSAADDVSGYITSRSLDSRNGSLKMALISSGEAKNVTAISQDTLDNINGLLTKIKEATATASSGALGTDEKVALAQGAFRLAEQIQTVADSAVFGGYKLFSGDYEADWVIGYNASNTMLTLGVDLNKSNIDLNVESLNFNLDSIGTPSTSNFAGVTGLDLSKLHDVKASELDIFSSDKINSTLYSLSIAMKNVSNVASYLGGIENRLDSQEDALRSQIVNYDSAISRIEDADVADEQMKQVKSQFLQQSSLVALAQANERPKSYLLLF